MPLLTTYLHMRNARRSPCGAGRYVTSMCLMPSDTIIRRHRGALRMRRVRAAAVGCAVCRLLLCECTYAIYIR